MEIRLSRSIKSNESHWSKEISKGDVIKSIHNSALCFCHYLNPVNKKREQIGFARVISDLVTHAYLQDVFILAPYRDKELGSWLLDTITEYEELNIRRIMLSTDDGHSFYSKFGFKPLDNPDFFMQIKGKGAI